MDASEWDERYAAAELVWSAEPNRFLPDLVDGLSPGTALDVACGEGRNAVWLAEHGWAVTGVDFSSVAIEKAERIADRAGVTVEYLVADLTDWQPDRHFDLIIEFYLQVPAEQRSLIHRRLAQALAPGGRFIVVAHHPDNLTEGVGGPQYPDVLYRAEEVEQDVSGFLVTERCERIERSTELGAAIDSIYRGRA